ncbi:hypothetical protein PoB_000238200 [Plakobranchus ocellatus]|uniref:Uncharacterized protein n=1 Tax=Plakobranchus ocellatus TaxID=259542 RepID=A0AAV3Y183_9GAST|nr:hypothetical protein PoB_000238200 [Plakobranchus ocellatus]
MVVEEEEEVLAEEEEKEEEENAEEEEEDEKDAIRKRGRKLVVREIRHSALNTKRMSAISTLVFWLRRKKEIPRETIIVLLREVRQLCDGDNLRWKLARFER